MLYLIGLGLGDERDITLKGLEAIKRCTYVYLEHYTAVLGADTEGGNGVAGASIARLEALYGKKVLVADREMVESQSEQIIGKAKDADVAFLVVGDPFASVTNLHPKQCIFSVSCILTGFHSVCIAPYLSHSATTHHDLLLRAADEGIRVETIHNASIMNAVAQTGLQLYMFGQTVSICFFREEWRPDSFYDKIRVNMQNQFHTLCLLGQSDFTAREIAAFSPLSSDIRALSFSIVLPQTSK
jgi:diphthine synthase